MGFIINQVQPLGFSDILVQLGILNEEDAIHLSPETRDIMVRNGGPVDKSRGFVLHSEDYFAESSHAVEDGICITATVDILRAISRGSGPRNSLMALGYSGWGAGQLESEIAEGAWIDVAPRAEDIFHHEPGALWRIALDRKGGRFRLFARMPADPSLN